MKTIIITVSVCFAVFLLSSCASNTPPPAQAAETPFETRGADVYTYEYGNAPAGQAGSGAYSPGSGGVASDLGSGYTAPGSPGSPGSGTAAASDGRIIYFNFDSSEIRADARPVIQSHARSLAEAPGTAVLLEGHADERGTREYNIGLGEQRGDAVRRLLIASGVSPEQIQVVSYGEERPAVLGVDEGSMALNRRVEIVY